MDEVQKKDFNVNNFDHIIETFSLEKFRGNAKTVSTELNQIQKQLFKYAEVIKYPYFYTFMSFF